MPIFDLINLYRIGSQVGESLREVSEEDIQEFRNQPGMFGGSYQVTNTNLDAYVNSENIYDMSLDVIKDFNKMEDNPALLNDRRTNMFYFDIKNAREQGVDDDLILENIQTKISQQIYGESLSNYDEASPYANQIIDSFLNRSSFKSLHDAEFTEGEQHFTLMPGKEGKYGRSSSVCADTACAVYTDAGMVNYLPWDKNKWASSNDYIIDALEGNKKGDDSYRHWNRVGTGSLDSSLKDVQPGDWVIIGGAQSWLPPDERGGQGRGNDSLKHSMIILDVTENGILMGSGNETSASRTGPDTDAYALNKAGIETRFYSYEILEEYNNVGFQAKVFRFNPQNDQFVHFENEIFSHKGEFNAEVVAGELFKKLMY